MRHFKYHQQMLCRYECHDYQHYFHDNLEDCPFFSCSLRVTLLDETNKLHAKLFYLLPRPPGILHDCQLSRCIFQYTNSTISPSKNGQLIRAESEHKRYDFSRNLLDGWINSFVMVWPGQSLRVFLISNSQQKVVWIHVITFSIIFFPSGISTSSNIDLIRNPWAVRGRRRHIILVHGDHHFCKCEKYKKVNIILKTHLHEIPATFWCKKRRIFHVYIFKAQNLQLYADLCE